LRGATVASAAVAVPAPAVVPEPVVAAITKSNMDAPMEQRHSRRWQEWEAEAPGLLRQEPRQYFQSPQDWTVVEWSGRLVLGLDCLMSEMHCLESQNLSLHSAELPVAVAAVAEVVVTDH